MSIVIQILRKARLKRFEGSVGARYGTQSVGSVIAIDVSVPNRILICALEFPGNLITSSRFLSANRIPATKLTCDNVGASIFQGGAITGAVVKVIMIIHCREIGRSVCLDRDRRNTDMPVA